MTRYIDADKLKELLDGKHKEFTEKAKKDCPSQYQYMADGLEIAEQFIDSLQRERPEHYKKDESLGSPDYERGFKHGRDYQTEVARKYTDKDKVVAYLADKGYPISTAGEIPTYQETFDMISNAIKYADQQEQPEAGLEKEMDRFFEEMPIQEHENIFEDTYQMIARHFWNKGYNARKKE